MRKFRVGFGMGHLLFYTGETIRNLMHNIFAVHALKVVTQKEKTPTSALR